MIYFWWDSINWPQQQPGSYRGGDDDDEMSVSLVGETGVPGGNHRPTANNILSHIRPVPSPRIELGPQRCEARGRCEGLLSI